MKTKIIKIIIIIIIIEISNNNNNNNDNNNGNDNNNNNNNNNKNNDYNNNNNNNNNNENNKTKHPNRLSCSYLNHCVMNECTIRGFFVFPAYVNIHTIYIPKCNKSIGLKCISYSGPKV